MSADDHPVIRHASLNPFADLPRLRIDLAEKEAEIEGLEDLHDEYGAEWGDRLSEASSEAESLRQRIEQIEAMRSIPPDRKGSR